MRPPLKLSDIDQEHIQELYDAGGVARDELPYSDEFEKICLDFQDRTFKCAHQEQVFGAILKYVRSGSCSVKQQYDPPLNPDQLKQLKAILPHHSGGGKILPYSDEFEAALAEFNKVAGLSLVGRDFWRSLIQLQGGKRRLPPRRVKAAPVVEEAVEEADVE